MPAKVLIFDGIPACFDENIIIINTFIDICIYALPLQLLFVIDVVVVGVVANLPFAVLVA